MEKSDDVAMKRGHGPEKRPRIHPCTAEQFDELDDTVSGTDIADMVDVDLPEQAQHRMSLTGNTPKARYSISRHRTPNASDAPPDDIDAMTTPERVEAAVGLGYVVMTLVLSVYYLQLLGPAMFNDLWWAGFNSTGAHSYLIDVYNSELNGRGNGSLDLTSSGFAFDKDYSGYYTSIKVTPTYDRLVLAQLAFDLPLMITTLLLVPSPDILSTQFCWIDFNRTWDVAHTGRRQQRCAQRYADNAAMYWETTFRLMDWDDWMYKMEDKFNIVMGNALKKSARGRQWLTVTKHAFTDVPSEVAYWQSAGLVKFVLQYTNALTYGVDETVIVSNAFGGRQAISIKRSASESRGSMWTYQLMSWGPWNDYSVCVKFNYSFVRSDPNNPRFGFPCNYTAYLRNPANYTCEPCDPQWGPPPLHRCIPNFESVLALPGVPAVAFTRSLLGPFGSIDAFYVPIPGQVLNLYRVYQHAVVKLMQTEERFRDAMEAIPSLATDPVPPSWSRRNWAYWGGDPTCPRRQPMVFPHGTIAFDVTCISQQRAVLEMDKFNVLLALLAIDNKTIAANVCSLCPTMGTTCSAVLNASMAALNIAKTLTAFHESFMDLVEDARKEVTQLQVQIIQLAMNMANNQGNVLAEQMVSLPKREWNFFGWLMVYDWAQATREVVAFEGDVSSINIMSAKYASTTSEAHALEVQKSSCQYLWVISVVVTTLLIVVGVIVVLYTVCLQGRVVGRNFLHFNRIVGSVWISRPLLMVRGMTAIIVLSTSPVSFVQRHGFSGFQFTPRSFFDSMVVAGEATWISYVLQDILLVVTSTSEPLLSNMTTAIAWVITLVHDVASPYQVESTLDRKCRVVMGSRIVCVSGNVNIGDQDRVVYYMLVQLVSIGATLMLLRLWRFLRRDNESPVVAHLLLSGTATAYLSQQTMPNGSWMVDGASCVMCGLVTFEEYVFDLKLWLIVKVVNSDEAKWAMRVFQPTALRSLLVREQTSNVVVKKAMPKRAPHRRILVVVGLAYMASTIFGSLAYLTLTETNMANDFWWANYNSSREHVFVSRVLNRELVLHSKLGAIDLTSTQFLEAINYNASTMNAIPVQVRPYYISQLMRSGVGELHRIVRGLRGTDACTAMWISTQYCWLDFNMTWEMANSAPRQRRCKNRYLNNGAVYLETVLRNIRWDDLGTCWGTSLDIGIVSHLNQSEAGKAWWTGVQRVQTSVDDEVDVWKNHNLSTFETDWQNYKTVGLIDKFTIQNAFGFSYPMTLKRANGSFRLESQTSMKMYWGFASDLWAVATPSTLMYGKSLLRQSSMFALTNFSMENVLVENNTIAVSAVTTGAYLAFRRTFGPFGSVDVKVVPVPPSLQLYVAQVQATLSAMRAQSRDFSLQVARLETSISFGYVPLTWLQSNFATTVGGNLMCNEIAGITIKQNLYTYTSDSAGCGVGIGEYIAPRAMHKIAAALGANLHRPNLTLNDTVAICSQTVTMSNEECRRTFLDPVIRFVANATWFPDESTLSRMVELARIAQDDVRALPVNMVQYAKENHTVRNVVPILHNILGDFLPSFHVYGWLLAIDWCLANREVISIQGDWASINVISAHTNDLSGMVNALEIPVNVAFYIRTACVYVTCVIICVAALSTVYVFLSRGYVEGLNLMEINRVAGIVWIGRTILFVRGLAAICLLSTEVLTLEPLNFMWHFVSPNNLSGETTSEAAIRYAKTFLAAGEVSWLGFVLSDMLMVVTQQHTTAYVFKCNLIIWGVSAVLSLAFPVVHSATLHRSCEIPQVDFQFVCTSGSIAIGSFSRFVLLIMVCVVCTVLCYLYERLRHPHLPQSKYHSYFLTASAQYVFVAEPWMENEEVFVDRASALINGILSVRLGRSFYIFDLKLWRLFVIDSPFQANSSHDEDMLHLLTAIPLPE